MNFFHAVSVYQLINVILYSKKEELEGNNCLIIRDILLPKIKNIEVLNDYFNQIIVYTDYWKEKQEEAQENAIVNYYDKLFQENNVDLEGNLIVVGCAHNTFGMYLSIKNIDFYFLEDAAGLMSRPYILDAINVKQDALKYQLICKYGLIVGNNPNIKKHICDFVAQEENFTPDENYIDFCVVEELAKVEFEERKKIMGMFTSVETIHVDSNTMVLLTQHFANLRSLSFEEQMHIYQIFFDYYTGEYNVVIKPHPDDLMYYPLLFKDTKIIKEKFPAEFLPFMFDNKPHAVATISSTSCYSLRSSFDNVMEMGVSFEQDYKKTHRYYVALRLIKEIAEDVDVIESGCNVKMLKYLNISKKMNISFGQADSGLQGIHIIDVIDNENQLNDIKKIDLKKFGIIVLNCDQAYKFYDGIDKSVWKHAVPIEIKKKPLLSINSEYCVSDYTAETIYLITQNENLKTRARLMQINEELKSTGIELVVERRTEEQERILILEGMLEATEKRLKQYIDKYGNIWEEE